MMMIQNRIPLDLPEMPETSTFLEEGTLCLLQSTYRQSLPLDAACDPHLRDVIEYILAGEGSFVRAQLGFGVMMAMGAEPDSAMAFGTSVELFHTASLVIDDLPGMDDATHRRGRVCPHVQFSEADAHLAALALIHHAYDLLFSLLDGKPLETARAARQHINRCLGVHGVLSGQSADVHFDPHQQGSRQAVVNIAERKTGALLELILGLPAILCESDDQDVQGLVALGRKWGVSYQILDDFKDLETFTETTGKTASRDQLYDRPNMVLSRGASSAWYRLNEMLGSSGRMLQKLQTRNQALRVLQPMQDRFTASAEQLMDKLSL